MRLLSILSLLPFVLLSCSSGQKLVKGNSADLDRASKTAASLFENLKPDLTLEEAARIRFRSHPSEAALYDQKKNTLYLTPYEELTEVHPYFTRWSEKLPAYQSGQELYTVLLNDWIIPQQLAYYYQENLSGKIPARPWDAQMQANLLAFLFVKERLLFESGPSHLFQIMEVIQQDLAQELNPKGVGLLELMEKEEASEGFSGYWYLHSSNFLTASRASVALDFYKMTQSLVRQRAH